MASITIDGLTIEGGTFGIADAYQRICDVIDSGDTVTVNLAAVEGSKTKVYVFRVTAGTRVSAVLEFDPFDDIPAEHSIVTHIS